ncbi:hypothetical protein [Caballeronia sp. SEWSISQ10-4 2]|nr:hypothetical protein [Caballeronia sp. SEWSISQ10-4 2]
MKNCTGLSARLRNSSMTICPNRNYSNDTLPTLWNLSKERLDS